MCFLCLAWTLNSCQTYTDQLVDQEVLIEKGFYIYSLPNQVAEQNGLKREIRLASFDAHCKNLDTIELHNPIRISYKDSSSHSILNVTISPFDPLWDATTKDIKSLKIKADWAINGEAQYYIVDGTNVWMLLHDRFGNQIVITSQLKIRELIILVNQLKYVGSELKADPWKTACGTN